MKKGARLYNSLYVFFLCLFAGKKLILQNIWVICIC